MDKLNIVIESTDEWGELRLITEIKIRQPKKCRGCIWGNWDGL